ncbi:MAG: GTPase, partial [Planctomycetota bacterium]
SRLGELGWQEGGGPVSADEDLARLLRARAPWNARAAADALRGCFENAWGEVSCQRGPAPEEAADWRRWLAWARWVEAPPRVILAGPPNAGKSTLFNAWVREERVTVSPHPGTTRDGVEAGILLGEGGQALEARLIDTAGLWSPARELDRLTLEVARESLGTADRVLWVFDAAALPDPEALALFGDRRVPGLQLLHRTDLGEAWNPEEIGGGPWLRGSVREEGRELIARLEEALLGSLGPPPPAGTPLPLGRRRRGLVEAFLARGNARNGPQGAAGSRGIQ